jgi:hypothetical protein
MSMLMIIEGDAKKVGHKRAEHVTIHVSDRFTHDELRANYDKNCAELDIHPETFDQDFGSGAVSPDVVARLESLGFVIDGSSDISEAWFSHMYYMGADGLVSIIMFLTGFGLPGFTWEQVKVSDRPSPTIPVLVSGVGYGMYDPQF